MATAIERKDRLRMFNSDTLQYDLWRTNLLGSVHMTVYILRKRCCSEEVLSSRIEFSKTKWSCPWIVTETAQPQYLAN